MAFKTPNQIRLGGESATRDSETGGCREDLNREGYCVWHLFHLVAEHFARARIDDGFALAKTSGIGGLLSERDARIDRFEDELPVCTAHDHRRGSRLALAGINFRQQYSDDF
ncbi:MAG: hypothetical protein ACRET4_00280 [Steroidobacteraceae bacterium]